MRAGPGANRRAYAAILKLHRQLGIAVVLIVLMLAITGVLINHAPALGLDQSPVRQSWILRWYHPNAAPVLRAYRAADTWAVWVNGQVVVAGKRITAIDATPVGLVDGGRVLVMAFPDRALVVTPDGRLVETLTGAALPGRVEAIAPRDREDGVVIRAPAEIGRAHV